MNFDYFIIGQGLAGTLLGYRLERAGKTVAYLDHPAQTAASDVAAGIINPITGRNYVKSWRIDELLPAARTLYAELEKELNVKIWHDLPLVRTLFNRSELNLWDVRSGDENYQRYTEDNPDLGEFSQLTNPAFAYAGIRETARVDIAMLVNSYRQKLLREGRFVAAAVDYNRLDIDPDGNFNVATFKAKAVIFCEGWRGRENPFFNYLPFGGAKGEILRVKLAGPTPERMLKHRIFLVPQSDSTYWVGATAENHFADDLPSPQNATYLEDRLRELVTVPYEILSHEAAVRPTTKDRRPFLGRHPNQKNLIIFNGLGTKGASLAPLCSRWLFEHLLENKKLPEEVDIQRYLVSTIA